MQKGFAPIMYVVALAVIGVISVVAVKSFNNSNPSDQTENPFELVSPTPSASVSLTPQPTLGSGAKTSKNSTPTPTSAKKTSPTPTQSAASSSVDSSCTYDLTAATGAVRVDIKPKNGLVVGDQIVELQAKTGCKVLDGRSTDKDRRIARAGGNGYSALNSVSFSTVPAGPYSVRIQYKGQWTGYSDVFTAPAQLRTVEITVDGENPTPTPPKPKPVCAILVMPGGGGNAPYQASVCMGNNSSPHQALQQEFTDYNGDGTWDYQGPFFGCHSYTFQNPGTYTPKGKIVSTSGEESEVCQTTVTVN